MEKTKLLKSTNDFVIGLVLLAVGFFVLVTDKVVQGEIVTGNRVTVVTHKTDEGVPLEAE